MIPEDEGKPMSIMEFISDEPCEPEAYIDYLIESHKAHLDYWYGLPDNERDLDKPTAKECVTHHIQGFLLNLDSIKRKMNRPKIKD